MTDSIETFGKGSLLQHGKSNERVYLMKLKPGDFPDIIPAINRLARSEGYSKIFCKVPGWAAPGFISDGFVVEAFVPGFYQGRTPAFFVSKFLNSDRLLGIEHDKLTELGTMLSKPEDAGNKVRLPEEMRIRKLDEKYTEEVAAIYREVFKTYPFPIHQPDYILKTMRSGVHYFGVVKKKKLIAVSSSETDVEGGNAELTDFATMQAYRGKNLAELLLKEMEKAMKKQGIFCLYTIARLNSPAMNRTFLKCGYTYAGTLIKNTQIAGKLESMNVLYRNLQIGPGKKY